MKHTLTLAALVFGTSCFGQSYNLIIEPWTSGNLGTTYRLYITANSSEDVLGAIFGNDEAPLTFSTPAGVYNDPLNTSWDASGINPLLLGFFPDLALDTYAAINLSPVIINGDEIAQFFTVGGVGFNLNNLTGGSWGAGCENGSLPPIDCVSSALPVDGLWLIAQVTTTGSFSGTINAQIFQFGEGRDEPFKE